MELYLLEYYEEIEYEDFAIEKYNLIGLYFSEDEAQKAKEEVMINKKISEDSLYISATKMGKLQWEGGFVSV